MPRGGARNRSGPPPDPRSGRSDRRGLSYRALPAEGYSGKPPQFPLPTAQQWKVVGAGKDRESVPDETGTISLRRREMAIWRELWSLPQGAAWAEPRQQWLWQTIAEFCRFKAIAEASEPNASLIGQLHRYRDQIGLTVAGMREHGWDVATDELAAKRSEVEESPAPAPAPVRRLRKASGGA